MRAHCLGQACACLIASLVVVYMKLWSSSCDWQLGAPKRTTFESFVRCHFLSFPICLSLTCLCPLTFLFFIHRLHLAPPIEGCKTEATFNSERRAHDRHGRVASGCLLERSTNISRSICTTALRLWLPYCSHCVLEFALPLHETKFVVHFLSFDQYRLLLLPHCYSTH